MPAHRYAVMDKLAANCLAFISLRPSGFGYAHMSPRPRMRNKGNGDALLSASSNRIIAGHSSTP